MTKTKRIKGITVTAANISKIFTKAVKTLKKPKVGLIGDAYLYCSFHRDVHLVSQSEKDCYPELIGHLNTPNPKRK